MSPKDKDTYYPKFVVLRASDPFQMVDPTTCFTMIPRDADGTVHDPWALAGVKAYADACEGDAPGLAQALRQHFKV